ncbi:AAA family ATPase [Paenibacillus odorifer]|uniref:AAA family ATPase n=1 Tax=Paenibacillus odorifer TaxID=189426 RepID=UPI00096C480F|nr:AAA family ATPase [Paenibacillus odorifer]OMD78149.1 hypothetical protein BSK50_10310 [Paenibacillus odorifer]
MQPQLLYVYIHQIGRCFERQGFCFTNDFEIEFDWKKRKLIMAKKTNPYTNLWGSHISNINLIIGKNGAGKTTLFELLGSTSLKRNLMFERTEWFAIYHIIDDRFVIEGSFRLLDISGSVPLDLERDVSICVKFDFTHQTVHWDGYLKQDFPGYVKSDALNEMLLSLYQPRGADRQLMKNSEIIDQLEFRENFRRNPESDNFQRVYLNKPKLSNIYRFMTQEHRLLEEIFTFRHSTCEIRLIKTQEDITTEKEMLAKIGFTLYQGKSELLLFSKGSISQYNHAENLSNKWSIKQIFILTYLENLIIDLWFRSSQWLDLELKLNYANQINNILFEELDFKERLLYLFDVLNVLSMVVIHTLDTASPVIFNRGGCSYLVNDMEKLPSDFFTSPTEIVVSIDQGFNREIYHFLSYFDELDDSFRFSQSLQVAFKNLSSGELEFIHSFSCLHEAIEVAIKHREINTIMLLLDEPDASFHPEWSRRFIFYITKFIELADFGREIKYQIFLSTHSPFIVSDIPREHITCIDVVENEGVLHRVVKKAEFGLMSNFYDIVKSDFFLISPIGEFAKQLFTRLLNQINEWTEYDFNEIKKVSEVISAIGEDMIRRKLQAHLDAKVIRLNPSLDMEDDRRITELEKELEMLKKKRGRNFNDQT